MYIKNQNNNYDFIINEAGKSIFKNIYKNCQNEIKDLVITKLLNKIKELNTKIEFLEKENKKLKDNFIYILKRILSNKDDLNNNNNYKNKYNRFINKNTDNNYSKNREVSFLENNFQKEKHKPHYMLVESSKTLRYNTEFNNTYTTLINLESENNQTKEAKAKKYLNNLYRKNFSGYTNGTPYSHFINKNKPIYEELFPKTTRNNYSTVSTYSNAETPKRFKKIHRRFKSTGNKDTIDEDDDEKNEENKKFQNIYNKLKNLKIDLNKYKINNKKKLSSVDDKKNKKHIQKNKNKNKRNISSLYNLDIEIAKSNAKTKNKMPYFNRSPYLINKV